MRVLVTRPVAEAAGLVERLAALGHQGISCPLLEIHPVSGVTVNLEGVQAVLITSSAGARALAAAHPERRLPVFTVGDATARAAREAGFTKVESARGDAEALVATVLDELDPRRGALLNASAADVAVDLTDALSPHGFDVRRVVLYEARPVHELPAQARDALARRELDAVLLFSSRTATTLARLVTAAGLADACRTVDAVCLSPAIATLARALPWAKVRSTKVPDEPALLKLLGDGAA